MSDRYYRGLINSVDNVKTKIAISINDFKKLMKIENIISGIKK